MKRVCKLSLRTLLLLIFLSPLAENVSACPDVDGLADLNCDGTVRILCFGDSITKGEQDNLGYGYPGRLELSYLPTADIKNLGIGGEDTGRGRGRAPREFARRGAPDYILILEGVNDYFLSSHSASTTKGNLFSMVRSAANVGAVPMLATLTDIRRSKQEPWVRAVNSQIRGATSIDFFSLGTGIVSSDALHPNGNGYQLMAGVAIEALKRVSTANRPRDIDGDGIYDFEEVRYGTNTGVADSDGDGVADGLEVFTYHSNPLSQDSDGDGYSDGVEINIRHTDPTSALPEPPTLTGIEAMNGQ